jgi:ABC-type bacteriocin/lantibiotic exporter with double-glycine peptidase domain
LTFGFYIVAFNNSWLLNFVASVSIPLLLIAYGILIPPFMRIHKITERYHEQASGMAFEVFSFVRIVVAFGAEAKLARQHEEFLGKVCARTLYSSEMQVHAKLFPISNTDHDDISRLPRIRRELLL